MITLLDITKCSGNVNFAQIGVKLDIFIINEKKYMIGFREENKYVCIYCGASSECRDHVIPVCYLSLGRNYDPAKEWIVPACNSCNHMAGAFIAFSIPEKAKYILKKFKKKYGKFLRQPEWTQEEMDELDYNLRTMVWGGLVAKRLALERQKILEKTCELPTDWERPDFILNQIIEARKVLNLKKRSKRKGYKIKKKYIKKI